MPVVVLAVIAIGFYFYRRGALPVKPPASAAAPITRDDPVEAPPPAVPPVTAEAPIVAMKPIVLPPIRLPAPPQRLAPEMVLPIQDQATIDFSIGSPVIKRDSSDAEALQRALKEMEEATRHLVIPPSKKP